MSGHPERTLTAFRTFSSFCDFTGSLQRSIFRSSVSIDGDKTCIADLSCGCLQDERVKKKITACFKDTGRWELRNMWNLSPFLLYKLSYLVFCIYSAAVRLLYKRLKGHQWKQTSRVPPLFVQFLFWSIKQNKNVSLCEN